jgi:hypothetical protein
MIEFGKNTFGKQVMLLLTVVCGLISSFSVQAQEWAFEYWHEGKIVLLAGDTLKGMVKYDLQQDVIQFSPGAQKTEAYTARKILFFEIFDNTVHRYRQFYALPYAKEGGYRAPVFFELLAEGKMTLLAREGIELRTYSSNYYYGSSYSRQVLVYKYFFLNEKGDIAEFDGNRNDLLDLMGKRGDDVEKYIKANKLKFEEKNDLARIVSYYNSLF